MIKFVFKFQFVFASSKLFRQLKTFSRLEILAFLSKIGYVTKQQKSVVSHLLTKHIGNAVKFNTVNSVHIAVCEKRESSIPLRLSFRIVIKK